MSQLNIFVRKSPMELMIEELEAGGDPDGLRYYQRDCYKAVLQSLATATNDSTLVVMATGLGKTQLFCAVAKHWEGDVLILAHRDELIEQARKRVEQMTGEYVEVEKAEQVSSLKTRIVVGSVQSLKRLRLERMGPGRFKLIIVDEAHHATAPSYKRIFDFFEKAKVIGVTATPDRADEKALGKVFDDVAYVLDIADGIAAGYLVPFGECRREEIADFDLDAVKKTAGDLAANELDQEMVKHCEAVVQKTLELAPGRTGVCFFPGVRSAELAAQRFNAFKPGSAAFVHGKTDEMERRQIMHDFKQGRIRYLCNCMVATEGFDAPNADLIVHARPTLSRSLYAQMTGRGTRPQPGVVDRYEGPGLAKERREAIAASKKPNLMVIDFVGNSCKHELVTVTDILGGNYSEAEVKAAKKLAKKGVGPSDALEQARKDLKALADAVAKAKLSVVTKSTTFDPFNVLGLSMQDEDRYADRFGSPASVQQRATLAKFGIPEDELTNLSKKAAGKLIDKCIGRLQHGLCSYRMLRQLQRFGVTQKDVRFDRAKAALDYIASKGWGKTGTVDQAVVADIVNHRRAAGED